MLEQYAIKEGINYLRLDSADDNLKLASYYEKLNLNPAFNAEMVNTVAHLDKKVQ